MIRPVISSTSQRDSDIIVNTARSHSPGALTYPLKLPVSFKLLQSRNPVIPSWNTGPAYRTMKLGSDPIITIIKSDAFTFKWLFIQLLTSTNIVTRSPSFVCEEQNKSDYIHKAVVLGWKSGSSLFSNNEINIYVWNLYILEAAPLIC